MFVSDGFYSEKINKMKKYQIINAANFSTSVEADRLAFASETGHTLFYVDEGEINKLVGVVPSDCIVIEVPNL